MAAGGALSSITASLGNPASYLPPVTTLCTLHTQHHYCCGTASGVVLSIGHGLLCQCQVLTPEQWLLLVRGSALLTL